MRGSFRMVFKRWLKPAVMGAPTAARAPAPKLQLKRLLCRRLCSHGVVEAEHVVRREHSEVGVAVRVPGHLHHAQAGAGAEELGVELVRRACVAALGALGARGAAAGEV
jgi:hypothetical protein